MTIRHLIPLTAALAFAVGCEKRADQDQKHVTETAQTPSGQTTTTSATTSLSSQDKDFVETAAKGSMAEVRMGQEASKKGVIPEVKTFGGKMVTDHSKAHSDLSALASKKGINLPTEMDKSEKDDIDKLNNLSGPKFDKEYADKMVDKQEQDLKAFQKEADDGKDPDVKQFAANMIPMLTQHVQAAKDMQIAERQKEGKAKK